MKRKKQDHVMHVTDNHNATYAEGITAGASDIEVDVSA